MISSNIDAKRVSNTKRATQLARFLFLCVIVGVVSGLGATVFWVLLESTRYVFLEHLAGYHAIGPAGEAPLFTPPNVALN
ncbi:MAG: hypothetical protein KJ052_03495, partial [Candidatus Hydrogenedentes bacterium]|nr:hypothetical protein [Candidatus Hydrogenedentota bacterium]